MVNNHWLVVTGTMEIYDFPSIGNVIIPTDELHDFSKGLRKTTSQLFFEEVGSTMKSLRGIRQTAASSTDIHLSKSGRLVSDC